ncbi:hypothetical protein BJV78DRAFT_1284744 [Lactifluus subvellereus]|nr:hypothetical protein BJV78DRAFT_1284744 [Lactifluus subvellereus]
MALQSQSRPEPMNATPHHSKVKVSVILSDPFYIAGDAITGKMELESRADIGLGLGIIMVELVAIEELTSRDHSATSTFLHTHRIFQGPGLPPSNAVLPHPIPGEAPLPAHYHRARRGVTTFLFRLPLPPSSPPSIDFGNGLARIRYEVRASIGVAWKDQNRLVTDRCPVDVLQRYPDDDATREGGGIYSDLWPAPESLVVGEGGKIWVQARVLGGILVAGEGARVELQVKNHSTKKTTGLHVTLSRQLHLPTSADTTGRKTLPPLQISDTLASIAFRGREYVAHPGTEGIAQLMFDVPRTARTVSAHPRHGGDADEDEEESDVFKRHTPPLFEVRGVVAVRIDMPLGSKDIVLELPVAAFHRASLPPPRPEPYPYPAPDPYADIHLNSSTSPSPPGLASLTPPMPYPDQAQTPFYVYPTPPPALPLLPQMVSVPLSTQLVIPPYRAHNGQLWFPSPPPTYVGSPYHNQYPPERPASANVTMPDLSTLPSGLPVSGTPDHLHPPFLYQQQQHAPLPEQATGHGARAARISHHLRTTSRARSVSPPLAQLTPPTPVGVDLLAPKPMPSPKIITETQSIVDDDDPFSRSFGRVGTRTRSLSVVRLEEMAARAAAEMEAKARAEKDEGAAVDKTLPVPPVPSGKPSGYGRNRRLVAQEIFQHQGHVEEEGKREETEADGDGDPVPRTPSLSALSLLRPPPRREQPVFPSYGEAESGLDALERRLAEQVGTRKHPPLPPEMSAVLASASGTAPPPPRVSVPLSVPGKSMAQEQADEVGAGAAVNESAISSLALGAEEDFGGRKANLNATPPSVEGEGEEEAEAEDADADGRTQRQGKGAGASSGSERGTHKARSRRSAKSDSKEKDRERDKERKGKRRKDKRGDDEAARLRRAAKGRVAEWLGNLEAHEPVPEPVPVSEPEATPEVNADQDRLSPPKLATAPTSATAAVSAYSTTSPVVESEPNPRSSGFIPVSTLRRAPISLPPASGSPATPTATHDVAPALGAPVRRFAHKYPANLPVEVKYDVKSARGGRGGRVTAVASIWAEAANAAGAGGPTPTRARPEGPAKGHAPRTRTSAANRLTPSPTPIKPMTSIVGPVRSAPVPAKAPRSRQTPPAAKDDDKRVLGAAASAGRERDAPRPPRTLFGLGSAAAATPSSPALSSSIATPVLSSTASLARPPLDPASAPPPANRNTPSQSSSPRPPQPQPQPQPVLPSPSPAAGQRAPVVNGGGFKAELAFGQARLRDLIKRYQG